jgi:group I intron endonuclease
MYYIYCILNTITDKVYIGQTINIKNRWNSHIFDLNNNKHKNSYLQNAWNKYGEICFEFSLLDTFETKQEAIDSEIKLITWYKELNLSYNIQNGGEGPGKFDDETRAKMSKKQKERFSKNPISEGQRKAQSEKLKGVPWSEARRIAEDQKIKVVKPKKPKYKPVPNDIKEERKIERARKLSIANKGKIPSEACRETLRQANLNRIVSEETKQKTSQALKGIKRTPEEIKKSADARRGQKRTIEQIERNRQAQLLRYKNEKNNRT